MPTLDEFYWNNPIGVIDQNQWQLRSQYPEMQGLFRTQSIYTPLVNWTNEMQQTGSQTGTIVTELMEGETDSNELSFTATDVDATYIDSRARTFGYAHYGKPQAAVFSH